jgi:hydroxymethylpyrimidine/phosphomethylpyrimidine kinase
MELYMKDENGFLKPVTIECVIDPLEWSNKLVVIKLGNAEMPATDADEEAFATMLESADVITYNVANASIIVGTHSVKFEVQESENG